MIKIIRSWVFVAMSYCGDNFIDRKREIILDREPLRGYLDAILCDMHNLMARNR